MAYYSETASLLPQSGQGTQYDSVPGQPPTASHTTATARDYNRPPGSADRPPVSADYRPPGSADYRPPVSADYWGKGGMPATLDPAPDVRYPQLGSYQQQAGLAAVGGGDSNTVWPQVHVQLGNAETTAGAHWDKGVQQSSLDPAPENRDPKAAAQQSSLDPAPENRNPKAVVQHCPVLDSAPENREQPRSAVPPQPMYPGYYGAIPTNPMYPQAQAPVTIPPKPVKTSKNFQWKTADDNHYYISICLIITCVFCLNPFGVCCACIGFYFARKAAKLNDEHGDLELARKHHKSATCCNVGAGVSFIYSVSAFVGIIVGVIESVSLLGTTP